MKKFFFALLLLLAAFYGRAQKITGVYLSYFVPVSLATDTSHIEVIDGYRGALMGTAYVSENPKTRDAIAGLMKKLKANGSEDISKCFIPRHCITLMSGDSVAYNALVCFECDGIRFSNEKKTTKVKNVITREQLMKQVKAYFVQYNFSPAGLQPQYPE